MSKSIKAACIVFSLSLIFVTTAFSGETGHYVNGVEGIKASTLPPPGFYYKMYNALYDADKLADDDGDELDVDFDVSVWAFVNRFILVTDHRILGADYTADIIIPFQYTDFELGAKGIEDDKYGFGDVCVEPFVLSWHCTRYDAVLAFALYVPTGTHVKTEPASPGKDFWTAMFTLGGTFYFDDDKTWSASILSRYEIHSEKDNEDITPGNDFHFEWGIGKTVNKVWELGLTGYCQWQVTEDSGSDANWDTSVKDEVYAIGPEVSLFIPSLKSFFSIRSQWEFGAKDRSEGNITTFTITKIL